jgi:energy-coupling factor transporter ATP-binding protein EcfA2
MRSPDTPSPNPSTSASSRRSHARLSKAHEPYHIDAPLKQVIELAGLSGTGKSTMATHLAQAIGPTRRVGLRARFSAPLRRPAYVVLMLLHARRWWELYRLLRQALSARAARRRLRMYVKHLWRRRQQIRSSRSDLVIEDESFATWFARDLARCPALRTWLEHNVDLFYPRRVGGRGADYLVVVLATGELLRVQRVHRRRLAHGPAYAGAEHARYGTFAERRPAVAAITALLAERGLASIADSPERQAALYEDLHERRN